MSQGAQADRSCADVHEALQRTTRAVEESILLCRFRETAQLLEMMSRYALELRWTIRAKFPQCFDAPAESSSAHTQPRRDLGSEHEDAQNNDGETR